MSGLKLMLDCADRAGGLHRGDEMIEEALLRAFEGRSCGRARLRIQSPVRGAGDTGSLECRIEMGVNDLLSRGSGNAEERGVTGEFP